jgi:6-phosphogluconate dehydrogenase
MSIKRVGITGLGVMGVGLTRNLASRGYEVAVHNRTDDRVRAFMERYGSTGTFPVAGQLRDMATLLERPRIVLAMVPAGSPVDWVIGELAPHLEPGDIIVDGGNSHYRDTDRRVSELDERGVYFVGMGVSGGEEGALHGPSLMPGGHPAAYAALEPVLTAIAAQTESGPCVAHMGSGGAGHFVKMVHNGIEYGDMQLIAEAYHLLRFGVGLGPPELAGVFRAWNESELESYLIGITAEIVDFPDDQGAGGVLVDHIMDRAGQKGTGRWTTLTAFELGVPIPTITAAVDARELSDQKDQRVAAAALYPRETLPPLGAEWVDKVRAALYASKICSYAQGFALIACAAEDLGYHADRGECARIWKGGCIIRAKFLDRIRAAFRDPPGPPNLLASEEFRADLAERLPAWREVVGEAMRRGIPVPAISASLAYFDAYTSALLPANLIQAQRDYFGAHTYQRTDREGVFHTEWL